MNDNTTAAEAVDSLKTRIRNITVLHTPDTTGGDRVCPVCTEPYPCLTLRLMGVPE